MSASCASQTPSSPGLWDQLSPIPLSSFHTPGNSQEQQPRLEEEKEASSPSPSPANPFDVGLPWTQGQHFATQVQRRFFLDGFRVPRIAGRFNESNEDEEAILVESSSMAAARADKEGYQSSSNKRRRASPATAGVAAPEASATLQAHSNRPRPRHRASARAVEGEHEASRSYVEDEEPSATQFFSRKRIARPSPPATHDDEDEQPLPSLPRRSQSTPQRCPPQQAAQVGARYQQEIRPPASRSPNAHQRQDSASERQEQVSSTLTSTLPATSRSLSVPLPPAPPLAVDSEESQTPRRGLAPLLHELSSEKQAGYWAQFNDDDVREADEVNRGEFYNAPPRDPRTPAGGIGILLRAGGGPGGRGVRAWASRVHSDSRLLPNRFTAGSHPEDENEARGGRVRQPAPLARQLNGDHYVAAGNEESPSRPCPAVAPPAGATVAVPLQRVRSALDITADMLESPLVNRQDDSRIAAPMAPPRAPISVVTPARSRNQHGMGLARKTWDTTWLADGARVVRGRVVRSAGSTNSGAFGDGMTRKKTTGRGAGVAQGENGSPSVATRRGGARGGRGGRGRGTAPSAQRGRGGRGR